MIATSNETIYFKRGEKLRILVGQQGTSPCDSHQDIEVCQFSNDLEACENLWYTTYRDSTDFTLIEAYLLDGGGGGGGASVLEYNNFSLSMNNLLPIVIAPGGGGAGGIYNLTTLLRNVADNSDELEILYRNYIDGHAFETFSDQANGVIGIRTLPATGGAGAGYNEFLGTNSDSRPLSLSGFGGRDYSNKTHISISRYSWWVWRRRWR